MLSVVMYCCYAAFHYAECHYPASDYTDVSMLNDIMLSVKAPLYRLIRVNIFKFLGSKICEIPKSIQSRILYLGHLLSRFQCNKNLIL
jgi:hypothetical protein